MNVTQFEPERKDYYSLRFYPHRLGDLAAGVGADVLCILGIEPVEVDRLEVFDLHPGTLYPGEMILEHIAGSCDRDRNYRDAGLGSDLEASLMERQKGTLVMIPRSLGENSDRISVFYQFDTSEDGLKALLDIIPVEEDAVHQIHPDIEARNLAGFLFCQIDSGARNPRVSEYGVEEASVISYI